MDQSDFPAPPPKRQRTNSPEAPAITKTEAVDPRNSTTSEKNTMAEESHDILDTLMQHVESESMPRETPLDTSRHSAAALPDMSSAEPTSTHASNVTTQQMSHAIDNGRTGTTESDPSDDRDTNGFGAQSDAAPTHETMGATAPPAVQKTDAQSMEIVLNTTTEASAGAEQVGERTDILGEAPVNGEEGAEWEIDSSPYESSSDSDSSSEDSDDDDDDADGDYAMLDPEEQARILMQADAGSDDEGGGARGRTEGTGYKTTNEQMEDVPPIPEVTVTSEMLIEELGHIEAIVENNVLIRAKVSGEYQVLESGSLLCFDDRKIAGVIAETLGRVEQPLYTMRFRTEQDIQGRGLEKGKALFYVTSHSSYVFTQPLKAVKGSDASNIHDEEVGDDEMEFSDDEAEAEHKRLMKLKRQGRLGEAGRGRGSSRGRGGRGGRGNNFSQGEMQNNAYGNGSLEMNYDDANGDEEGYVPLSRPSNLHEMMTATQEASRPPGSMLSLSSHDRNQGRGRGRGGRDRGRGNNSHRGRGGFQQHTHQPQNLPQAPFPGGFPNTGFPLAFPPPPPPLLAPQNQPYQTSVAPSPISPLPHQQYHFGSGYQGTQFQGNQQQPLPNHMFNPAGMQSFAANNQANGYSGSWQTNQAAVAEVQRQLEEMRKLASQGGNYPPQQ